MANDAYRMTWDADVIDAAIQKIPGLESAIGDLSALTTEQKANLVAAINELVDSVATKTKNSNISASFDTTKAYSAGDYVIHDGDLYRAKEDISAGAWDASKWTLISIGEDLAKKANVDGNYEGLTSGFANNLTPYSADDGVVQEAAFISQGTGTGNNLVSVDTSTVAQLLEKSGQTLQVVQPVKNGTFSDGTNNWLTSAATVSASNNEATVTSDETDAAVAIYQNNVTIVGHKYYVTFRAKSSDIPKIRLRRPFQSSDVTLSSSYQTYHFVGTADDTGFRIQGIKNSAAASGSYVVRDIYAFDITSWPADIIADLTANPSHFSWYYNGSLAYNPGSLENSTGRYLVCTKRNLWDEQLERGSYNSNTGEKNDSATNNARSKNKFPVIPNRPVYFRANANSYGAGLNYFFYDAQGNYIGNQASYINVSVTPPANARFATFATWAYQEYANDITISLYYSPEQGGEGYDLHYPYEEPFVCDTGDEELKSAGSAKDKKAPSGVISGNVGTKIVDGSTALSISQPTDTNYIRVQVAITNGKTYSDGVSNYLPRIVDYESANSEHYYNNEQTLVIIMLKSRCGSTQESISAYFATNPFVVNYELGNPTTTQSTPYNPNLTVDDYGMMYWLDTNGNLVSVPQPCKVSYNTDYKGSLDTLIKHANGDMTDVALNSEMEEVLSNKASIDIVVEAVKITDPATTLGDVSTLLDEINTAGRHVFFDVSALGASMYLCTIFIDTTVGVYKVMDQVVGRVAEGSYESTKLLVQAIANASSIAVQSQIDSLQEEIDELGGKSMIKDYEALGNKILDGTSTDYINPGDKIDINWITTVTGSTTQSHTVTCSDIWQFAKGVGEAEPKSYLFVYNGSSWTYNDEAITLSDFGLSVSGTPATGEVMTVQTAVATRNFTFTGYDKSDAHDNNVPHNWTLEATYAPDTLVYDTYEAAFTLAAGKTLAAGAYKLTNYSHRSSANLTIYFTVASAITNSGETVIQFASNGYVTSGSYYIPSSITPYQKGGSTALASAMACSMTEITGATDVSTVDGVALPGSFDFAVFGNNNWEYSNARQYLNDETLGDSYVPTTDFDRPIAANRGKGFLYGIDPRAYALLIDVDSSYTAGYGNAGKTQDTTYTCTDKVFLLSMKEMSFNINTNEGSAMDLYSVYTNNTLTNDAVAARAKYNKAGGTLNSYRWSRSAGVSNASHARVVTSTGAYSDIYAIGACYVAPAFCFGKHSA